MGSFDEYPAQIRVILERAEDAGFRDILVDEQAGKRFLYEALSNSSDDTLREIGEQLRDGLIDTGQLAASSCYRGVLQRGIIDMSRFATEQWEVEPNPGK